MAMALGAMDANGQDMWEFSDGTGALSLDVALVENCAILLYTPHARTRRNAIN